MVQHRPSPVLELPDDMWWCLGCSKRWPCADATLDADGFQYEATIDQDAP